MLLNPIEKTMMTSWSYSMYSTAIACLRKYKLIFIDKLQADAPPSGDMAFGTTLHFAVNAFLHGDDGEELFRIYWSTYKDKELAYSRFRWAELEKIGVTFCRKFVKLHASKYQIQMGEQRLYAEYKGMKLEGTTDFIGKYKGKMSVRDFKSSAYAYDVDKKYNALQINLYAYLCIVNGLVKAEELQTLGYTVFCKATESVQDITWEFDVKIMYKMLDEMLEYCTLVSKQDTYPRNPNECIKGKLKCDYFNVCWKEKE